MDALHLPDRRAKTFRGTVLATDRRAEFGGLEKSVVPLVATTGMPLTIDSMMTRETRSA